ncbi:bifunctional metallophosphatase/5'-nucleotidase [Flavilitoribacter nigricans]|nr:bifunctional metallophosphatase/5'-nucleotidase [Flavilitoribacter nigricans]
MYKRFRGLYLQLFVLLALGLGACQTPQPATSTTAAKEDPIEFIILQLNDVYEIAPLEGGKFGGLARVATLKKQLLRENPNTIAVLSGDFLSPSFIGTLRMDDGDRIAGLQMVETLNAMGMDYVTFGNHEFDLSNVEVLKKRIDQSDFRFVCANAKLVENGMTKSFSQKGAAVPDYVIHEIRNAGGDLMKLAITGLVLPFAKQDYVEYLPVEETFRKVSAEMEEVADVSVALTHLAARDDIALAKAVPGFPLFMGGHEHVNMSFYIENTVITKADANAKTAYVHRGTYYPSTGQVSLRSSLITIDDKLAEDPATKVVVDKWLGAVDDIAQNMGFNPARELMVAEQTLICTEALIRSQPTNYGGLTTRAFEAVWPDADVYLLNSGSMRLDDNLEGTVTEYDVLRTYPFGGPIVKMELHGEEMGKLLKTGLFLNKGEGGYFQTLYVQPAGQTFTVKGETIDPGKTYSVVLPQFVAEGKEANLEFLADHKFETQKTFNTADGKTVNNDMRNIVIYFMDKIGRF